MSIGKVIMKRWTEEEDNILLKYYQIDPNYIDRLPGRNKGTARYRGKVLGLSAEGRGAKGVKIDIFDNLEEKSAWLLGLISADGCVRETSGHFRLFLNSVDIEVIKYAYDILETKTKMVVRHPQNRKTAYYLNITNDYICKRLGEFGILPRKSLTQEYTNNIPEKVFPHFLRGVIDGDGWISINQRGKLIIGICGTCSVLSGLSVDIAKFLNIKQHNIYKDGKIYKLSYSTIESLQVARFIYTDATVYMHRKYNTYSKFCLDRSIPCVSINAEVPSLDSEGI